MREIKFRGRRVDNGEYVYGDYLRPYETQYPQIRVVEDDHVDEFGNISASSRRYDVRPESVAQLVGYCKGWREVYEGDKLKGMGTTWTAALGGYARDSSSLCMYNLEQRLTLA